MISIRKRIIIWYAHSIERLLHTATPIIEHWQRMEIFNSRFQLELIKSIWMSCVVAFVSNVSKKKHEWEEHELQLITDYFEVEIASNTGTQIIHFFNLLSLSIEWIVLATYSSERRIMTARRRRLAACSHQLNSSTLESLLKLTGLRAARLTARHTSYI